MTAGHPERHAGDRPRVVVMSAVVAAVELFDPDADNQTTLVVPVSPALPLDQIVPPSPGLFGPRRHFMAL